MKKLKVALGIVLGLLLISIGLTIFFACNNTSLPLGWLQSEEFVEDTTLGILVNSKEFRDGEALDFTYDFNNEEYAYLKDTYSIDKTAGSGSEFIKAKNLMHEYSSRIKHDSTTAVSPENMNAKWLLENHLDNKKGGTYCRAKAQILNEMCLALGIYSRKLWTLPLSKYDNECHVENEIWDTEYNKWIMLDITNDIYWVDNNKTPLSILEIRDKIIAGEFCTPVSAKDDLKDLNKSLEKNKYTFYYYVKNLAVLVYLDNYTVGETNPYYLSPVNYALQSEVKLVSRASVEASPKK